MNLLWNFNVKYLLWNIILKNWLWNIIVKLLWILEIIVQLLWINVNSRKTAIKIIANIYFLKKKYIPMKIIS